MSKHMKGNLLLLLTTVVWGSAFVAQKAGADIGNFTFGGIRTIMAGLTLLLVIFLINKGKGGLKYNETKESHKMNLIGGVCCGFAIFVASTLQQFGVSMTTVSNSGFITTLYVVFVPILSLILGRKVRPIMWICVILGVTGFYFLCLYGEHLELKLGDFLVLLCALAFAIHIMVIDHFVSKCNGIKMSCVQFIVSGILGIICMFIFEEPNLKDILSCWLPLCYAGILSGALGYTLQIVGQKYAEPSAASMILCLESVFAAISGAIFLNEKLTLIQYLGCLIIFAASIVSNLPEKKNRLK